MSDESLDVPSAEEMESFEAEESAQPVEPVAEAPKAVEEIKQEIQKLEREYKIKVRGKEITEKIDLNDEQRIIKALQMEKMATEATQRAAAKDEELASMNNQLDKFFELLRNNPLELLMNPALGLNAEELANKILDMKIEEEMKTPEQKEKEELQAKLSKFEQKEKEAREESERLKTEKIQAQFEKEISESVSKAIESGKLPASPYIIQKFGQLMDIALEQKVDISPEDLIPLISKAYKRDMKEMASKMSDEELEEVATPDRIKAIRNKRIQAVKASNAKAANQIRVEDTASAPKKESQPAKKENFFKSLGDW
jgi:hypothetical protein